jgi:hypothetical protein
MRIFNDCAVIPVQTEDFVKTTGARHTVSDSHIKTCVRQIVPVAELARVRISEVWWVRQCELKSDDFGDARSHGLGMVRRVGSGLSRFKPGQVREGAADRGGPAGSRAEACCTCVSG